MIASSRAFLEKYSAQFAERAAARRAVGGTIDITIADALDRIVAGMRTELAAAPPTPAPIDVAGQDGITWKSPVFNVGGRLNPFAGTKREGWLASADACERLGHSDIAETYRCMAAAVDPEEMPDRRGYLKPVSSQAYEAPVADLPQLPRRSPPRRRSSWTGPPLPPPEPTAFAAGPQMDMFS